MINELATSTKENTISSREVAEMIGERHDSLLRKIDRINENLQNANLCSDSQHCRATVKHSTHISGKMKEITV